MCGQSTVVTLSKVKFILFQYNRINIILFWPGCPGNRRQWPVPERPLKQADPNLWSTASISWRTCSAYWPRGRKKSGTPSKRTSVRWVAPLPPHSAPSLWAQTFHLLKAEAYSWHLFSDQMPQITNETFEKKIHWWTRLSLQYLSFAKWWIIYLIFFKKAAILAANPLSLSSS